MTALEATGLAGLVVSLLGVVVVPLILNRRLEARLTAQTATEAKTRADAADEISWAGINRALVAERDRLTAALKDAVLACDQRIRELREALGRELAETRQRLEFELGRAEALNKEQEKKIDQLYARLYTSGKESP